MPPLRFSLALFTVVTGFAASTWAAPQALIIVGLTAGDSQAARLQNNAETIRTGLIARGLAPHAITVLGGIEGARVRRDQILAALKTVAAIPADSPVDERWIVLLGTANARGSEPSFQVSGPRLSATDLAAAVKLLPGAKRVVIGTSASGGFLPPLLALPDVEAVAATSDSGEINEPRFLGEWANALATTPNASFAELAAVAAEHVKTFYEGASLAQGENARLIFRPTANNAGAGSTGSIAPTAAQIIEAPFPHANTDGGPDAAKAASKVVANTPPRATPPPSDEPSGISVSDIQIPKPAGDGDVERRPATDETRALLTEAIHATRQSQHAALYLRVDKDITIGSDFAVLERHRIRAYLRTGEALDDLGTLWLPTETGYVTRLDSARVITPDGSQILVNPKAFDARRAEDNLESNARAENKSNVPGAPPFLPLPEVTAGCIVEAEWTVERTHSADMPEFTQEWPLAEQYPIRALHLTVTTPNETHWRTFAPNLPAPSTSEGRDGPLGRPGRPPASAPTAIILDAHSAVEAVAPLSNITVTATANKASATTRTQRWTLTDVAPLNVRTGDAPARTFTPWVGVSSLESWDAFAEWYLRLATGSTETGPGVALLADEIGRAHPDRAGRLRAAYERVAALRYVSFPLGVGAIRARTPEQVWKQRYGDCKDKAGLLVSVLGKLGITAEFALVNRFDHTFTEWPAWQFNHAIARVPAAPAEGQPLDLWLDTTDRLVPFGVVAPGDLGRDAFAFNAEGKATFHKITADQEPKSVWSQTRTFSAFGKNGHLDLEATGSAEVTLRRLFANMSALNRAESLQSLLGSKIVRITQVTSTDPYDLSVPFKAQLEIAITGGSTAIPSTEDEPRPLIPGFAFFQIRRETANSQLLWDDGRDWTVYQNFLRISKATKIPDTTPAKSAQ